MTTAHWHELQNLTSMDSFPALMGISAENDGNLSETKMNLGETDLRSEELQCVIGDLEI